MKHKNILVLPIYLCLLSLLIFYLEADDDTQDDLLHVENTKIVDKNGKEVWPTRVKWFGFIFNTGNGVFDGVLHKNSRHWFYLLRLPICVEVFFQWKKRDPKVPKVNGYVNPEVCEEDGTLMPSFKVQ